MLLVTLNWTVRNDLSYGDMNAYVGLRFQKGYRRLLFWVQN